MRKLVMGWMLVLALAPSAWCQPKPAGTADSKPVITVALPSTDSLFEDMKLVFDLAEDSKGFKTLKETIEVFLVGVETDKSSGVRVYSTGGELPYVLSLPVKSEAEFKEFLLNMWDLDLKSFPAPTPALGPQVPRSIQAKGKPLKLAKNERLMFNLFEGFLRFDSATGQVHISEKLEETRQAKGGIPADVLKGQDLAVFIDGSLQTPDERRKGFAKAKKEVLGAVTKGEKEEESAFTLRKAMTEQQMDEIERFFAESSKIDIGWTTSAKDKNARLNVDLAAVPMTPLEESINQLGQTPDEFAGIASEGTVLHGAINFPLDAMRKANVTNISKLARDYCQVKIDGDAKLSAEQKGIDKDLANLMFDVVDGIANEGLFNAFTRIWSNGDGTLSLVGGVKVPDGASFVKILETFASRGGGVKVELKVDTEGDVEIHKLSLGDLQKDYPELLDKDGTLYVGTAAKAVWLASGEKSLERLKTAIQEAKRAGPQPGPVGDLKAQLYPLVEVLDKVRTRQVPPAAPKTTGKKAVGAKAEGDAKERAAGILADLQIRKVALEAFKPGKDTLSLSLVRADKDVKLALQLDEGILRFVGKAMAKFVKENLADD